MPTMSSRNPLRLSFNVLRYGTTSLQGATTQETTKCLNRVGHFCLNVAASTSVILTLASFLTTEVSKTRCDASFLILAVCMWLQLAAARNRTAIPLFVSTVCELLILLLVGFEVVNSTIYHAVRNRPILYYAVAGLWIVLGIVRLLITLVLYKVLTVKNPQFALSTTVFLKPTNTPVTFSSVLAPQDLDPTNPYHSQTVYNINSSHANPLNKTVA